MTIKTSDRWLRKFQQYNGQAKAINDEFAGKGSMPAEAARQLNGLLAKAAEARREYEVAQNEEFLAEPQYKHDMTGAGYVAGDGSHYGQMGPMSTGPAPRVSADSIKSLAAFARGAKSALVADATGDAIVPHDWAGLITREISRQGVLRARSTVRPTTRRYLDIGAVNVASATWGVVETGDPLPDGLGNPPVDATEIKVWDLNALVKIGRDELNDTDANLVSVIHDALASKMAEQEDDGFANGGGDATKRPLGIAQDATITQGITAATEGVLVADDLTRLTYQVPAWARRNGAFYAHSSMEQAASLLKSSDGKYLWEPATADGRPATFRGYPWYTVDGLPGMASTGTPPADKSVFFGDMASAYLIADRQQILVQQLNEAFISEGKIGLLFTHRVGGRVIRPKALAWLKL